jgi:hypothetical protein
MQPWRDDLSGQLHHETPALRRQVPRPALLH